MRVKADFTLTTIGHVFQKIGVDFMQKALQGDGIKEIERPFVAKGTPDHPPRHNTRHRVERLESFAFLKEFSGISYQTHSGGKGEHWRFPIEILYKMVERQIFTLSRNASTQ